ncbi:MAG: hypothetical protein IT175_06250 [Acidobacteria bacterium]|nr:hypothetical protein [Acidobacteriota bacterium]
MRAKLDYEKSVVPVELELDDLVKTIGGGIGPRLHTSPLTVVLSLHIAP